MHSWATWRGYVLTPQRARIRLLRAAGVTVERHLVVYSGLRIVGGAAVTVGDRSLINHDCLIDATADITIGCRAALGFRVSLVAAGAVVRCDVPPHTMWGGVPARQLQELPVEIPVEIPA